MFSHSFLPVITRPTRVQHSAATLIDHIWVKNKSDKYSSGIILNCLSDHFPTYYIEQCKTKQPIKTTIKTRKINDETIPSFINILSSTSWGGCFARKKS